MIRSQLWPIATASYDSIRLSDWSHAGYHDGNGVPPEGATIIFGPGDHVLSTMQLYTLSSFFVLKGAGRDVTRLHINTPLSVFGTGFWGPTGAPGYSWGGGWLSAENASEVGIEDLTIIFPPMAAASHHYEQGYNAIFWTRVTNGWIRRVRILNADSGIILYECTNCLVDDVEIGWPDRTVNSAGMYGHYGVMLGSSTVLTLVRNVRLSRISHHDLSVQNNVHHNVFERCSGVDLCLDHHRNNPHQNLWVDINVGAGTRPWLSGGNALTSGQHNGDGNVFWNLHKADGSALSSLPVFSATEWKRTLAIVGHTVNRVPTDPLLEWVEAIPPSQLGPRDLYLAQRGEIPPTKFAIGQRVKSINTLTIRSGPAKSYPQIGSQPMGILGTVKEGPVKDTVSGFVYWRFDFDSGTDGWAGEDRLVAV